MAINSCKFRCKESRYFGNRKYQNPINYENCGLHVSRVLLGIIGGNVT